MKSTFWSLLINVRSTMCLSEMSISEVAHSHEVNILPILKWNKHLCGHTLTWNYQHFNYFHLKWTFLSLRIYTLQLHTDVKTNSTFLHMWYLEIEADFSKKSTRHLNKTACEILSLFDKVDFWPKMPNTLAFSTEPFNCMIFKSFPYKPLYPY